MTPRVESIREWFKPTQKWVCAFLMRSGFLRNFCWNGWEIWVRRKQATFLKALISPFVPCFSVTGEDIDLLENLKELCSCGVFLFSLELGFDVFFEISSELGFDVVFEISLESGFKVYGCL